VLAAVPVTSAPAAEQGRFNLRARVTAVVDGDTLNVRLNSGRRERIRVLGIDAPERGACYASEATARARALAGGRRIRLIGDARQPTRDRFGRRLAYITLPNGFDLGTQLLTGGFAKVLVVGPLFTRILSYTAAESVAEMEGRGMWTACAPPSAADLAVTNTDTPDPVLLGTQITYTVTVTNAGPGRARGITLTDTLSVDVSLVSASITFDGPRNGTCTGAPVITCTIDTLAPEETATLTVVVTAGAAGTLPHTATVIAAAPADPNTANNAAETSTTVTVQPPSPPPPSNCHPSYPTVCIPPPPPDLDCGQIPYRNFQVVYTVPGADPHNFDGDRDGVGCES
jgi:uncharacterized repeat protein (TIGR01451 family)